MGARKIYIITKEIVLAINVVFKIYGERKTSIPKFGQRGQIQDLLHMLRGFKSHCWYHLS